MPQKAIVTGYTTQVEDVATILIAIVEYIDTDLALKDIARVLVRLVPLDTSLTTQTKIINAIIAAAPSVGQRGYLSIQLATDIIFPGSLGNLSLL